MRAKLTCQPSHPGVEKNLIKKEIQSEIQKEFQ